MDAVPSTPSATPSIPSLDQLREKLTTAEQRLSLIQQEVAVLRHEVANRLEVQRRQETVNRAEHPQSMDDLLAHPSYESDESSPSDVDEQRKSEYEARNSDVTEATNGLRSAQSTLERLLSIQQNGPAEVVKLQAQINAIDAKYYPGRTWNRKVRLELAQQLTNWENSVAYATSERIAEARTALRTAEREAANYREDQEYEHLENAEVLEFSPRESQAVLMKIVDREVTLHLPDSPDDPDFSRTVHFAYDSSDFDAFIALIGENARIKNGVFDTLAEEIECEFDITDELVPFALEVVEVNGEQRYRIPQIIWEKFGANRIS